MSKPKVFEKPAGLKDYLPDAVMKLRNIESNVLECMQRWGYRQIITPTLEYYDTVGASSATSDNKLFKLLNTKGTTLVLRSDMTAPIARVASSLLRDTPLPLRLSYHSNVFRTIEEKSGQAAEFFQTGVELIGEASPEADAEVVALAIATLQAAGVRNFQLALGHVGFLNGLFAETLANHPDEQENLKQCLLKRDYVGYRQHIKQIGLPDSVQQNLNDILRLRGGQEICEQAKQLGTNATVQTSIDHLCEVWEILKSYDVCEHVVIDLTMLGDFSYYTGLIFEGYASDLGFPVCSGGRYDHLLQQFGRSAPATGFALKTTRILEVVHESSQLPLRRVLIIYRADHRTDALRCARELRLTAGQMVETQLVASAQDVSADQRGLYDEIIPFL